jgi:hypothetical protein
MRMAEPECWPVISAFGRTRSQLGILGGSKVVVKVVVNRVARMPCARNEVSWTLYSIQFNSIPKPQPGETVHVLLHARLILDVHVSCIGKTQYIHTRLAGWTLRVPSHNVCYCMWWPSDGYIQCATMQRSASTLCRLGPRGAVVLCVQLKSSRYSLQFDGESGISVSKHLVFPAVNPSIDICSGPCFIIRFIGCEP